MNQVRQKMYMGNPGEIDDGWAVIGLLGKHDGATWSVYRKEKESGWDYIKVVANKRVPRKANYWLSWNGHRFASGFDFFKMMEHRADLGGEVSKFMRQWGKVKA